ncbi:PiggyBac transposable element-derived protein 4 [Plakobranchus ocellatus]|uniref:PiggyBac transposable element-derived protein 4 n=1 Tax=Plakobranchus ocellatus TaxID=259542 RepID=A0AAV4AIQ0_9GAST|nr:PiggyBac transposable element-derived protein 4 [Plakobranchus ocellatus]
MIGTVKRNKTFLPVEFQAKNALPLGESKFLFRHETTLVSFQSKRPKNVILLSTTHQKPEICPETTKPDIVLDYNKMKGGVDAMDQMAHAFTTKRKTKRWLLVVFFNILDLSSIAARVIFQLKYPVDKLSHEDCRQRFNADVGRSMAYAHIVRRSTVPTLQKEVKDNISFVIKSIKPVSEQMAAKPPKRARVEETKKAGARVIETKGGERRFCSTRKSCSVGEGQPPEWKNDGMLQLAGGKAVLVVTNCSRATLSGETGGREADGMRDTRCEGIVLRKGLVEEGQLTRESSLLIRIENTALLAVKADVNLRTPYLCGKVKALCIPDAIYDVIVGNARKATGREDPDMSVMVGPATTRAQTLRETQLDICGCLQWRSTVELIGMR